MQVSYVEGIANTTPESSESLARARRSVDRNVQAGIERESILRVSGRHSGRRRCGKAEATPGAPLSQASESRAVTDPCMCGNLVGRRSASACGGENRRRIGSRRTYAMITDAEVGQFEVLRSRRTKSRNRCGGDGGRDCQGTRPA